MHLPANVRYPATMMSVTKTHESTFSLAFEITVLWGLCWLPVLWDEGIIYIVNVSFQNRGILYFWNTQVQVGEATSHHLHTTCSWRTQYL